MKPTKYLVGMLELINKRLSWTAISPVQPLPSGWGQHQLQPRSSYPAAANEKLSPSPSAVIGRSAFILDPQIFSPSVAHALSTNHHFGYSEPLMVTGPFLPLSGSVICSDIHSQCSKCRMRIYQIVAYHLSRYIYVCSDDRKCHKPIRLQRHKPRSPVCS